MIEKFVVQGCNKAHHYTSCCSHFLVFAPLAVAVLVTIPSSPVSIWIEPLSTTVPTSFVLVVVVIVAMSIHHLLSMDNYEERKVILTVDQTTLQISTWKNGKNVGQSETIAKANIVDVVVNEIVLSHKVVSVVVIRLCSEGEFKLSRQPREIETLMNDHKVKLQLAFPGVDMSYIQCITMRQELCKALDL